MLKIFQATGPRGPSFTARTLLGPVTAPTREELDTRIAELRAKMAKVMGREPTDDEFTNGPPKPKPTAEQERESRRQKVRAERAARLEAEAAYSPEAERLRTARERAEAERIASLSPAQRELESAAKAAQEAEQRKADKAKREEIRQSAAYRTLRQGLDDALLIARLDPAISQEQLDALVNQSEQLERTTDIASVRANISQIQRAISGEIELRDAQLREAVSRSELRKRMLASGSVFDAVDVETIGDLAFVCLTVDGQTKKISQSAYDARQSDEQLRDTLFGSEVTND